MRPGQDVARNGLQGTGFNSHEASLVIILQRTVWRSGSASASGTGLASLEGPPLRCAGPAGLPGSALGPIAPTAPPPGSPACQQAGNNNFE